MSAALATAGASIFLLLGIAHAVFSVQSKPDGGPMMPTNPKVRAAMGEVGGLGLAPEVESTLYRAWIGFNLSHSLGVAVAASVLLWHAVDDLAAAVDQGWFLALAFAVPAAYLLLAVNYWFAKPRDAIILASALVWLGVVIELF